MHSFSANTLVVALAAAAGMVAAHFDVQAVQRREFLANSERTSLAHCGDQLAKRSLERRQALFQARAASLAAVLKRHPADMNKSHVSAEKFGPHTPTHEVFAKNAQCLLSPETTEGPFYVMGERVRRDLTEGQKGLRLVLDLDVLDVSTCKPVPHVWVEIYHSNATGIYSGVPFGANSSEAPANINTTFLRGLQRTDAAGAVQFDTVYPGHYALRTQHIHIVVHQTAARPRPNNQSMYDLTASHVGQMYFDQALSDAVKRLEPYDSNYQPVTGNADDTLLQDSLVGEDPFMTYNLLGDSLEHGLFGWYSFGINTTFSRDVKPAAILYEDGAVLQPQDPPAAAAAAAAAQNPLVDLDGGHGAQHPLVK